MALASFKIRIIANTVITRYDDGEGTLNHILDTNYSALTFEDRDAVLERVCELRPDIVGTEVIKLFDLGEGTVDMILSEQYPTLDTYKERVKAYIYSVRSDVM